MGRKATDVCACGVVFDRYRNGSRRRYCSPECRAKHSRVGDRLRDNPELAREIASLPKPNHGLRGHRQTDEHRRKRLGAAARARAAKTEASRGEKSLVGPLAALGFDHVGSGDWWRAWPDGSRRNPDFVNEDTKTIVEYLGYYFHANDDVGYARRQWRELGYALIVVWDYEREQFLTDPVAWVADSEREASVPPGVERRLSVGRGNRWAAQKRKTHCVHDHELAGTNLRARSSGRSCRSCEAAHDVLRSRPELEFRLVAAAFYRELIVGLPCPYRRSKATAQRARVSDGSHHQKLKTRCPRDHLLVEPNLDGYMLRRGHRKCKSCDAARRRVRERGGDVQEIADRLYLGLRLEG